MLRQEDLIGKPALSKHNEPQHTPQEYDCGCVTAVYVTHRDYRYGQKPFELRLAVYCDTDSCQIRQRFMAHTTRDLAVALVDSFHGYTCEFASVPSAHAAEYDRYETVLAEITGLPLPFYSDCVEWPRGRMAVLNHICEAGVEVDRETFMHHVVTETIPQAWFPNEYPGWYGCSYWRLPGFPVYWYVHSLIEFVFAAPETIERVGAALATEAVLDA